MTGEWRPHEHPHYESALLIEHLQEEVARLSRDITALQTLIAVYLDPDSEEEQEQALSSLDLIVPLRPR